jgi:glycosyltransferase involved in cell wall biosynthesis
MNKSPFLSIVIPAYNEETNIRLGALEKVARYLQGQKYSRDVIVVDDGSTDATGRLLDDFAKTNNDFRVIHNAHLESAGTVITGVESAAYIVLFKRFDQPRPLRKWLLSLLSRV